MNLFFIFGIAKTAFSRNYISLSTERSAKIEVKGNVSLLIDVGEYLIIDIHNVLSHSIEGQRHTKQCPCHLTLRPLPFH